MKQHDKENDRTYLNNESGMTLVEVLASIVLISMILTTFLSFFIQSAKTNHMTDDVNQATFVVQAEMELLGQYDSLKDLSIENGFEVADPWKKSVRHVSGFTVNVTINKTEEKNLYQAIVEASKGDQTTYAKMETYLSLKE